MPKKENQPKPATKVATYLADPRLRTCLEAAAETAILLGMVVQRMKHSEAEILKLQTRVLLARCLRLCRLLQDGLGDEAVSTERIQAVLRMEEAEEAEEGEEGASCR